MNKEIEALDDILNILTPLTNNMRKLIVNYTSQWIVDNYNKNEKFVQLEEENKSCFKCKNRTSISPSECDSCKLFSNYKHYKKGI